MQSCKLVGNIAFLLVMIGIICLGGGCTKRMLSDKSQGQVQHSNMYVKGDTLYDANGKQFIVVGINLQYGDAVAQRIHSIAPISTTGSNFVRLQLRDYTTAEQLDAALKLIISNKMIVMPFYWEDGLHGGTGPTCSNDPASLQMATNRWVNEWREVMQKPEYQKYLLLNVANEWGRTGVGEEGTFPMTYEEFTDYYIDTVAQIRQAGHKMPIVIDAPGCGQDYHAFLEGRGKRIVESDPEKNVAFSIHGYWHYHSPELIDEAIQKLENENIVYMFGEYGNQLFHSTYDRATDYTYLIKRLREVEKGWAAWSWYGNGEYEYQTSLDMSSEVDKVKLTPHGKAVIYGENGISTTAKPASYW